MKRSRSGARPSTGGGGGSKNIARAHVRYKYALTLVTPDGELTEPTEDDMQYFRTKFPGVAKKLSDSASNAGFEAGTWQETCYRILDGLVKQKRAMWFRVAVDPQKEGLNDYFTVIKEPMDLGTVKMRLQNNFYTEHAAFADAVRLTFNNAKRYNRAATAPHDDATKLLAQFEKKYQQAFAPTQIDLGGPSAAGDDLAGHNGADAATDGGDFEAPPPSDSSAAAAQAAGGFGGSSSAAAGGLAPPTDWTTTDDDWGAEAEVAATEQPKAVVSDEDSDDDDEDDEDGADRSMGSKAPQSAVAEDEEDEEGEEGGGKHPSSGGKAPAGMDDSGLDETADSEADLSDSALDSEVQESGDEGGDDDLVSDAEMFGDEDEDFDFEQNGGGGEEGEESSQPEESEAEGGYDGAYAGESSSMMEGSGDYDEGEESEFDEFN